MNKDKSQVFFSLNLLMELSSAICKRMGFVRAEDLGKYLGLSIFHERVGIKTFEFVVNRV